MSIHPQLRKALEESREDLTEAAAKFLNSDRNYARMKARYTLNVVIPFLDWFMDEADAGEIAEVARCATGGLSHMVALLASTAGDDKMLEHGALIISEITKELAHYLSASSNTDEK